MSHLSFILLDVHIFILRIFFFSEKENEIHFEKLIGSTSYKLIIWFYA